ncbi:MAG: HK97 family phage prohead protease [Phycisphaerae bacterium]|nr:HK97 family phage prohead protease [Phycisphaerae bacterium]
MKIKQLLKNFGKRSGTVDSGQNTAESFECRNLVTRVYQLRAATIDETSRSIEAVIATESPVMVLDWNQFEVIEEVLIMAGCEIPPTRQVPMLDTHDRRSVQSQLGSTRDLKTENDQLIGRNYFADTPRSRDAFNLIKEGHLQDNSIGYQILESVIIERGKSAQVVGKDFQASPERNLRVVTKWIVKENSVCPIGADALAKNRKDKIMPLKNSTSEPDKTTNTTRSEQDILKQGAEIERKRAVEIRKTGAGLNVSNDVIQRAIDDGTSIDEFKTVCLDEVRKNNQNDVTSMPGSIVVGDDLNVRSLPYAIVDAILCRAGVQLYKEDNQGNIITDSNKPVVREKHSRTHQFMGRRIPDIARMLLIQAGHSEAIDFNDRRAVQKAIEIGQRSGPTISTITLSTILSNAMGKSLLASYVELQPQWQKFATKKFTPNFKEVTRARLGELDNLETVGEGGEYKYAVIGESKEVYRLRKTGCIFGISWESLINDDLSGFSQIPQKLSAAARRMEDSVVFAALISSDTMDDGVVLFHTASHGNLAGSGAVISIDTLNAGKLAFRMQRGTNDGDSVGYLNLIPKVLIVPAALEGHATQLLDSEKIQNSIAGTTDAEEITFTTNPWFKKLELCVHPILDGTSATAWYLSTGPGGNGIEICFLDGAAAPYLEREESFEIDAIRWKVRHVVASKAIDYKQLYKNAGA